MLYLEHMAINIEVTRDSSFCPGVDRAFKIAEKILLEKGGRTFSVGPLIHNPEVVRRLGTLGLEVIDPDDARLPDLRGHNVVIRSHGIDTATEQKLQELGAVLVDATCPTVKRAQQATRRLLETGHRVVVLGAASHPEVRSIVGRAGGPVAVLQTANEAALWAEIETDRPAPVGIVCQTTISRDLLSAVRAVLAPVFDEITVMDTICASVTRRQEEASELAGRVDVMIVVGGRNSSNTSQLVEKCEAAAVPTHLIENASEIDPEWLEGVASAGVTGGASTPEWLIKETTEKLRALAS
ncbi:MAG: 4-hydroxy-3-methylbut-2-enyl diphosphate reductase [Candidatus Anoxymicrobium japonicum]|uniref:4-hydroxy-3-methylbut-2-enyl diphosphate reductase n=1 Tax=Candidatus Anoxymicrobium japonicum TaxID=2013648 RepID=A0A2N3G803_9ACTN|nr:MAG: 4-hydroxy-3-methylbut-2-enyl diphosphate reductase [Candidatus Anoxymicrobium japonicum]